MEDKKQHIDIKKFLPHRKPMLMADELISIANDNAEGKFFIPEDCIFIENNCLSETGLIEHAAQICSAVVGQQFFLHDDIEGTSNKVVGYISAIKKVHLYRLPQVNSSLTTKASLVNEFDAGNFKTCTVKAHTFNNAEIVLDCTLNFLIHEV